MAMTKAEKARLEELETALALCWPPYPCPKPLTPDEIKALPFVDAGESYGRRRKAAAGFFFNAFSGEISAGFSDGVYHSRSGGGSWSQNAGRMYRTRSDAAQALRHEMSLDFAKKLAAVDRIIADPHSPE